MLSYIFIVFCFILQRQLVTKQVFVSLRLGDSTTAAVYSSIFFSHFFYTIKVKLRIANEKKSLHLLRLINRNGRSCYSFFLLTEPMYGSWYTQILLCTECNRPNIQSCQIEMLLDGQYIIEVHTIHILFKIKKCPQNNFNVNIIFLLRFSTFISIGNYVFRDNVGFWVKQNGIY